MRFDLLGQLALQDIAATCPDLPCHGSLRTGHEKKKARTCRETHQAQGSPAQNMVLMVHDVESRACPVVRPIASIDWERFRSFSGAEICVTICF